MVQFSRRINSSLSVLFFTSYLSLSNLAFAQLTLDECERAIANEYYGLYSTILNLPAPRPMKWCPLWAAVCSYVYRYCSGVGTCQFTNYDPNIKAHYNPASSTSYHDFLVCTLCDVEVSVDPRVLVPINVDVPHYRPSTTTTSQVTSPRSTLRGIFPSDESSADILADIHAENPPASSITSAVTTILVLGSIVGSLIAVKATSANAASLAGAAGAGVGATATIANPKTGSGSSQSIIDAVTLLLHFQSISTSGLLSVSYPGLYRFFTYNFAWANLIIGPTKLKKDVWKIGYNPSCLARLGSLTPSLTVDPYAVSGIGALGWRYDLDRATIGGLVYLSAIIGVAVALAVFVLVALALRILNAIFKSNKLQAQVGTWPSKASSLSLRLFIWAFGSISTFAIYQFAESCSSASLIAFGAVEFILIILTLLTVSIFIIKIAKAQGLEALYPLSDSESSKYSRKWGSLYAKFKPDLYWFFIPDYIWVLTKSIIVGVGQGTGLAQVCALLGIELATLFALLIKRPYATSSGNAFHIFSTCKRVFTSACLLAFWDGYGHPVPTKIKRIIGIVLISIESAYAIGLFIVLLFNGGKAIFKWNAGHQEQRRVLASEPTSPLEPHLSYASPDFNPVQEKF